MIKLIIASVAAALCLSACGGGSDTPANTSTVAAKSMGISFYGNPLQTNPAATVAHALVAHASAATDSAASGAAATTASGLTAALAADGVTANITVQTMDGTALHAVVMGTDNGVPPPNASLTVLPDTWLVVNFVLDDMVTPASDPTQAAAIAQFQTDMTTFIQQAHLAGKQTLIVVPIPTCDAPGQTNATAALTQAESNAGANAVGYFVGGLPQDYQVGHMGADCMTPDAYILAAQMKGIAYSIAFRYNGTIGAPAQIPATDLQ